jgi:hypothetical protein
VHIRIFPNKTGIWIFSRYDRGSWDPRADGIGKNDRYDLFFQGMERDRFGPEQDICGVIINLGEGRGGGSLVPGAGFDATSRLGLTCVRTTVAHKLPRSKALFS